jgi:F-type H+-transporting ATPase subunit c
LEPPSTTIDAVWSLAFRIDVRLTQEIESVKNFSRIVGIGFVLFLVAAAPAAAQQTGSGTSFSGAIGAGVVVLGAAYGIGKLAASAVEGMSRQPEVAGRIQTAMIIAAALIEGFTFYALVICQGQNPWAQG